MRTKPNPPKRSGGGRKRRPATKSARAVGSRPAPPAHLAAGPSPGRLGATPGSNRESAILDFIAGSLRDRGYPPTIREIGTEFGIASTNGVRYYLDRLEHAGRIRRDRWTSRGIELQTIERGHAGVPDVAEGRSVAARAKGARAPVPASRLVPSPARHPAAGADVTWAPHL